MFKVDEDTPLQAKILSRQIENAQRNIEGRNFSIRKSVLEYDNVMNTQREIIYAERGKVLKGLPLREEILSMINGRCQSIVDSYTDPKVDSDEWDCEGLNKEVERKLLPGVAEFFTEEKTTNYTLDELKEMLYEAVVSSYQLKIDEAAEHGVDFEDVERYVMLRMVDQRWMAHIDDMDALRSGIGLKAYGQQDPVLAYQKEGFDMFDEMVENIHDDVVTALVHANVQYPPEQPKKSDMQMVASHGDGSDPDSKTVVKANSEKVGRNEPCPCGSGKKYKNCCGKDNQ